MQKMFSALEFYGYESHLQSHLYILHVNLKYFD